MVAKKVCRKCGPKHVTQFGRLAGSRDGMRPTCRKCHAAAERSRHARRAEERAVEQARSAAERPALIVGLFDEHHPNVCPRYESAKLALLADLQPDEIVFGGDFGEWTSGSAHVPDAFRAAYEEDCQAVRSAFWRVRRACPRAQITVLEGNHDNAVLRMLSSNAPSMVVGFWERFARDLDFERLGVEWVSEKAQPLKRGNLRLMHGHQIAKMLPKHHAAKVADEWGAPGLTVAFGHSHRPGVHVKAGREGNCRAIAVGAGRTLDPDWMKGRPGGWEN